MNEINVVIQQSPNKIDVVMQPLVSRIPIELSMTKPGPKGEPGLSAYEVWIEDGNVGSATDYLTSVGSSTFIHDQIASSNTWVISHGLGKYPSVSIVDTGNTVIIGDVVYLSTNELQVSFTAIFSGKAYLN